jgi:hypothetical protein
MAAGDITVPNLSITLGISGRYQREWDPTVGGNVIDAISIQLANALTNGTGSNNCDLIFRDTRSVTAASPDDIDLAGGLTDIFGQALTFVEVAGMAVFNQNTVAAEKLEIGGDANAFDTWLNDSTDIIIVPAGGIFVLTAPIAGDFGVTAATGDILQIDAQSGTVTYDIVIWGRSA